MTNSQESSWWNKVSGTVSQSLPFAQNNKDSGENSNRNSIQTIELNNLKDLSEAQSLAFCGALFAMAAADGSIEPGESVLILQFIDAKSFSRSIKHQLQCYSIMPPALEECLKELPLWDENLRWQLIFYLLEIAWFDDVLDVGEKSAISTIQKELDINNSQIKALNTFVCTFKKIGKGEIPANKIEKTKKDLIKTLQKERVPIPNILTQDNFAEIEDNQKYYSEEYFWGKMKFFGSVAGREVVEKALILYFAANQAGLDPRIKAVAIGALGYFISPIDFIPDIIPLAGYGDDLSVLMAALPTILKNITPEVTEKARQQTNEWLGEKKP